jgi:hypothetical protein
MSADDATRRQFLAAAAAGAALPALAAAAGPAGGPAPFEAVKPPAWVYGVTRMAFGTPGEVEKAARSGVQVFHTNVVWPYFPLRRDGGGLSADDGRRLRDLTADCHHRGIKLGLGLPPFPPVALARKHPDWRVHPDDTGAALKVAPAEDDLGTRLGCNLGPWGDYLIAVCAELVGDYGVDCFSFDGNYHPPLCFCPACKAAYRKDRGRDLPPRADLDDVAYREYLAWRGERLEDHYRRLQQAIKAANPDAALISWTVNAGRYGHFLYSPRAMPTRLNRLFDLPMQEWWHDETNLGASVAPAFGAAYLRAVAGDRPCASEPYLMARGNPYGTDSFPAHERLTRAMLNLAHGGVAAESFGWPGHVASAEQVFREVRRRAEWLPRAEPLPWAALLVSEQTRQFYAYRDIAGRFVPHVFGAFRAALEEHLPLTLVNDWDLLDAAALARYAVLLLPNAATLSDAQAAAVRAFVRGGGGLVATGETSLCDELGRPRRDFALADVFGVSYRGRPAPAGDRPALDENFAAVLGDDYWNQRVGVATLTWGDHPLLRDAKLRGLVPGKSVNFRGPLVRVIDPGANEVAVRMTPEGKGQAPLPALVLRRFGEGRVAYFAAAVDAALWSYPYPYQRRLLARALEWAARGPAPVTAAAPLCVQAAYYTQPAAGGRRVVVHLFNGVNTAAGHGLPAAEVPLREEVLPVHGVTVRFRGDAPKTFRWEPDGRALAAKRAGDVTEVEVPPLEIHGLLVGEG